MPEAARVRPGAARLPRPRRSAWWWLIGAVALAHLLLVNRLSADRVGWGAGERPPARIEVAFVRDLQAAAPPAAAPAAPPAAPALPPRLPAVAAAPVVLPDAAPPPAATASAPEPLPALAMPGPAPPLVSTDAPAAASATAATTPAAATALAASAPGAGNTAAGMPSAAQAVLPAVASAASGAAAATPPATANASTSPSAPAAPSASFDWPPSTRLSYLLNGHYRGPVSGRATVEWLRQGERYQVRMGTSIGPVLSRNIVSDGVLGAQGLVPQRFAGEQKVLFRAAKRWTFSFEPDRVVLEDGSSLPNVAGVQDEASQFVQLTWLFTTRPDRLRVGQSVELPLLISRKLSRWTYDVVEEETLNFPFGAVATFHVKPRREATGGDLSAEMWIAPTLQYLPVRILIRQNAESQVDLTLERAPEQAAR